MALTSRSPSASSTGNSSFSVLAIVIVAAIALAGGAVWWFFLRTPPKPPGPPPLTEEAREYVRSGFLALSEVEMKAAENYMMTTVVEITGKITNKGPRPISAVELTCLFRDPYGQVIHRERVPIVRRAPAKPFRPGDTRPFRMAFDSIPAGWNQVRPDLVIARIDFEDARP